MKTQNAQKTNSYSLRIDNRNYFMYWKGVLYGTIGIVPYGTPDKKLKGFSMFGIQFLMYALRYDC